ncbi:hypothetical protein GCM10022296_13540 [Secundilactobacillus similis DSM 23365 = JCM 2765]
MRQVHTKYGNVFPVEARIFGELDQWIKEKRRTEEHGTCLIEKKEKEGKQRGQR